MKKITLFLFIILIGSRPTSALNVHIIESQSGPGQTMDTRWETICTGMGHAPTIYPYTHLDVLSNFSSADILIVSSATLPNLVSFPIRISNIQQYLQNGGKIYLQSEYLDTFDGNQAFTTIVNSSGGFFNWTGIVAGTLSPMNPIGSMANNYSQTGPISNFWYGHSIDSCSSVEMFIEYQNQYFGCIFCHASGGRISTTSDQDWTFIGNNAETDSLMQNIVFNLSEINYNCVFQSSSATINLGNDTSFCTGGFVLLNAGSGFSTYTWSTGSTTSTILVSTSDTVWVQATGPCVVAADTIIITVFNCIPPVANGVALDTTLCPGTCTDFTNLSVNATSYQWYFPGASPSSSTDEHPAGICYNTPGTYNVSLIATNAIGSDSVTLTNYISIYPYSPSQSILQSGDTLISNLGFYSYQWFYAGDTISGATNYYYVATQSGDYSVVCLDENGCNVEAVLLNVVADIQSTIDNQQPIMVYPNPVTDQFTIHSRLLSGSRFTMETAVTIYNVLGETVFSAVDCELWTVDCRQLPTGMYYLVIRNNNMALHAKFLKE